MIVGAILATKTALEVHIVAAWMAAAAATETLIAGGTFTDAILSGLSNLAFSALGIGFNGAFELGWASAGEVIAFGAVGGIATSIQGGKFGHGFRSAGLGAILGGAISDRAGFGIKLGETGRNIAKVILGGTLSEVSGGKFANGAAYTAFSVATRAIQQVNSPVSGKEQSAPGEFEQTTFEERAAHYRKMAQSLGKEGIDSVWFEMAAELNQMFADRAWLLLGNANDYLNDLGDFLFQENKRTYNSILAGDISLCGQELDNFLVKREQLLVQEFTYSRYPNGVIPNHVAIPVNAAFRVGRFTMPRRIRIGVKYVERMYSESFNYWDTSHRITLGESMMSTTRHGTN